MSTVVCVGGLKLLVGDGDGLEGEIKTVKPNGRH